MLIRATTILLLTLFSSLASAAFDEDGSLYVSPTGLMNNAFGRSLALRQDGGFYAAGIANRRGVGDEPSFELRRFDGDGVQDADFTFSLLHQGTMSVSSRGLLVQPDGAVIAALTLTNPASPTDSFSRILRVRGDGATDPGFDDFEFDASSGADRLDVLALQADGRILAAGARPGGGGYVGVITRLRPDGTLDTGFGVDGYVSIGSQTSQTFAATEYTWIFPSSVNLLADGRVFVAGSASDSIGSQSEMFFARFLADGNPDPTFNGGEPLLYAHRTGASPSRVNHATAADVSPAGVFLVGGRTTVNGSGRACLWQFDIDATLMAAACDRFGSNDTLSDVQLLPNGGAVGVGFYFDGSFTGSALMAFYTGGLQFSGAFSGRFESESRSHTLGALAYDPHRRRLLSIGTGITEVQGLFSNRWVLASDALAADLDSTPDTVGFGPAIEVLPATVASAEFELRGIDEFVRVPVRVAGGRFEVNGVGIEADAGALPALGFYNALQEPATLQARVSHLAPPALDETTTTEVEIGGVVRSSNLALTVGPTVQANFLSVTRATPVEIPVFADGFEEDAP